MEKKTEFEHKFRSPKKRTKPTYRFIGLRYNFRYIEHETNHVESTELVPLAFFGSNTHFSPLERCPFLVTVKKMSFNE